MPYDEMEFKKLTAAISSTDDGRIYVVAGIDLFERRDRQEYARQHGQGRVVKRVAPATSEPNLPRSEVSVDLTHRKE